jgi:hypothetical protein
MADRMVSCDSHFLREFESLHPLHFLFYRGMYITRPAENVQARILAWIYFHIYPGWCRQNAGVSAAPSGKEVEQEQHDCNNEHEMNETTGDMESKSTPPKDQKNNGDN